MLVMGQQFSIIMTGVGIVALAGIVVNNNIILIDTYQEFARYMPPIEAVIRTAEQRLRPVALTTITSGARRITPTQVKSTKQRGIQYWYVLFTPSQVFQQLEDDTTMNEALMHAMERGFDNPLFTGGDLVWKGVIVREIPELPVLKGVGAGGADVGVSYLCGAGALASAWVERPVSIFEGGDYGRDPGNSMSSKFRRGVGIDFTAAFGKLMFGTGPADGDNYVDNGVVTIFTAV